MLGVGGGGVGGGVWGGRGGVGRGVWWGVSAEGCQAQREGASTPVSEKQRYTLYACRFCKGVWGEETEMKSYFGPIYGSHLVALSSQVYIGKELSR